MSERPAICGVMMTFSILQSEWPFVSGSGSVTSTPAPESFLESSALTSESRSYVPPLLTAMKYAPSPVVGAPAGMPTCDQVGHLIKVAYDERGGQKKHCVRTTHAEANAIAQAAKYGTPIDGATIYIKMTPCLDCTKLLVNAGIRRVVCRQRYHADHDSVQILAEAGVELTVLSQDRLLYDQMA